MSRMKDRRPRRWIQHLDDDPDGEFLVHEDPEDPELDEDGLDDD